MSSKQNNADRFSGFADIYENARPKVPRYPVDVICRYLGGAPRLVVDMGCGTGLSSEVWQGVSERIIGIEPSGAVVIGETRDAHGEIPLYVAEEYSDYSDNDIIIGSILDNEVTLEDRAEKQKIIRSFESVLYKYDGEFKDVSVFILKYYYYMRIRLDDDWHNDIWAGMYSWNCIAPHEWDEDGFETAKGRFYSSVLGKVDASLFVEVDPR